MMGQEPHGDVPTGRSSLVAQVHGNSLFIFGGYNGQVRAGSPPPFRMDGGAGAGGVLVALARVVWTAVSPSVIKCMWGGGSDGWLAGVEVIVLFVGGGGGVVVVLLCCLPVH